MSVRDVLVSIQPLEGGWRMDCSAGLEPIVFGSGAKAEAQAHALARKLARAGADARVEVHDRGHRLVGTTRYFADG
ncbi:hypothetical protein ACO2Q0_19685 [Phenylobacterium sp. VNQ135]|uniref:hypothetical protein n=1 Tax=Phenylobacterium sp. VNQ135 TaxID=3400922 RepID=UPI003C0C8A4C